MTDILSQTVSFITVPFLTLHKSIKRVRVCWGSITKIVGKPRLSVNHFRVISLGLVLMVISLHAVSPEYEANDWKHRQEVLCTTDSFFPVSSSLNRLFAGLCWISYVVCEPRIHWPLSAWNVYGFKLYALKIKCSSAVQHTNWPEFQLYKGETEKSIYRRWKCGEKAAAGRVYKMKWKVPKYEYSIPIFNKSQRQITSYRVPVTFQILPAAKSRMCFYLSTLPRPCTTLVERQMFYIVLPMTRHSSSV